MSCEVMSISDPRLSIYENNTQRIFLSQYPTYHKNAQSDEMEKNERLKQARIDAGFRFASHAADSLGVKRPTYVHHENGTRDFGADEARQYARRFKVSPEWLLYGTGSAKNSAAVEFEPVSATFTKIPIRGEVAAGLWREVDNLNQDIESFGFADTVVLPQYPPELQFGLIVRGESLNKIAPNGSTLHCLEFINGGAWDVQDGDLVIVQRTKYQGALYEMTAKRVRKNGDFELWPESNHPDFQNPLKVKDYQDEACDEEVRILAKVLKILIDP